MGYRQVVRAHREREHELLHSGTYPATRIASGSAQGLSKNSGDKTPASDRYTVFDEKTPG